MQTSETIIVDGPVAACDGAVAGDGHPRVYLNLAPTGEIECPYCSRHFVMRGHVVAGGHGVENAAATGPGAAGPKAHEPPAAPAKP
jgi:uncharacterized Zn-finger protein